MLPLYSQTDMHVPLVHPLLGLHTDDDSGVNEPPPQSVVKQKDVADVGLVAEHTARARRPRERFAAARGRQRPARSPRQLIAVR